jgi:hypothetical protein
MFQEPEKGVLGFGFVDDIIMRLGAKKTCMKRIRNVGSSLSLSLP